MRVRLSAAKKQFDIFHKPVREREKVPGMRVRLNAAKKQFDIFHKPVREREIATLLTYAVPTAFLGPIHSLVRQTDQFSAIPDSASIFRYSDAARHRHSAAFEGERFGSQRVSNALRMRGSIGSGSPGNTIRNSSPP